MEEEKAVLFSLENLTLLAEKTEAKKEKLDKIIQSLDKFELDLKEKLGTKKKEGDKAKEPTGLSNTEKVEVISEYLASFNDQELIDAWNEIVTDFRQTGFLS